MFHQPSVNEKYILCEQAHEKLKPRHLTNIEYLRIHIFDR